MRALILLVTLFASFSAPASAGRGCSRASRNSLSNRGYKP
jgi:hypothetical protein